MQSRLLHFVLYLSGTVAMLYGVHTDWVDDGSFRLQDHPGGSLFGFAHLLTSFGTFTVIGWSIYNALTYTKREPPSSPAMAKTALATAAFAAIAFVAAIVLTIAAYSSAVPASTLLEAPAKLPHVTMSPWLALEGCASIAIGALLLWRAERRRK